MTDWHGYPQHPDAHPERPWWRAHSTEIVPGLKLTGGMIRSDGALADTDTDLAAHDLAHPLPAPNPRCGQVWALDPFTFATVIYERRAGGGASVCAFLFDGLTLRRHCPDLGEEWPPPGAVLVAGPGAPWAPMGGTTPDAPRP